MRTKITLILLVLCLFISGCNSASNQNTTTSTTPTHPLQKITLGLTPEQLLSLLSEAEIQIELPDYTEFPLPEDVPNAIPDGRIYNMTDLSFYYKAKNYDLFFTFSYEGSLRSIHCRDAKISTPKGLAVGDSMKAAKALYGTDCTEDPEDMPVIQYKLADGYFNVFYADDTVTGWSLNTYPNINND